MAMNAENLPDDSLQTAAGDALPMGDVGPERPSTGKTIVTTDAGPVATDDQTAAVAVPASKGAAGANALDPTPDSPGGQGRYCPACGVRTANEFCAADGTATVSRKILDVDATTVREGDVIEGRYRVTGVLGRGGFGAVYSAEHTGTQQKVALKMLLPSADGADEAEVRRFYREAQVTAKLKHPNTVRVFDVGQTPSGALYIAMEQLHGPTLEGHLRDRARDGAVLDEGEAIHIAISVLRSLHEAHGQGLVHRDLKPANIMLADSGDDDAIVKVLDFGIARAKDSSLTGAGTALGTPAYMSPEQCQGLELDGRSDVYSLGVILYRCVAGAPPFADRNPLTLMFNHAHTPPPDLRETARTPVSDAFVRVVQKSLEKSRDDRYANAKDMRQALEAAAGKSASELSQGRLRSQQLIVAQGDSEDVNSDTATHAPTPSSQPITRAQSPAATARTGSTHLLPVAMDASQGGAVTASTALGQLNEAKKGRNLKMISGITVAVALAVGVTLVVTRSPSPAPVVAPAPSAPAPAAPVIAAAQPVAPIPAADPAKVKEVVRTRVVALNAQVEQCFKEALAAAPELRGKRNTVSLHFRLGPGGALSDVTQTGATAQFATCITDRFLVARGFPDVSEPLDYNQSYVFDTSAEVPVAPAVAAPVAAPAPAVAAHPSKPGLAHKAAASGKSDKPKSGHADDFIPD